MHGIFLERFINKNIPGKYNWEIICAAASFLYNFPIYLDVYFYHVLLFLSKISGVGRNSMISQGLPHDMQQNN